MTTENERLRALLAEALGAIKVGCPCGNAHCAGTSLTQMKERIKSALAEPVSDDFRRGAEAMREAAAQNCAGEVCASQIRALPVPEDR